MCGLSKFKKVSERNTNDIEVLSSKSAEDERDLKIMVMIRQAYK